MPIKPSKPSSREQISYPPSSTLDQDRLRRQQLAERLREQLDWTRKPPHVPPFYSDAKNPPSEPE